MTALTFIAFALMKKANFRLDPDNIGFFALIALVTLVHHHLNAKIEKPDFSSIFHSAALSS